MPPTDLPGDLHLPSSRSPISYPKMLLVEGRDAFEFFKALLRHLGMADDLPDCANPGMLETLCLEAVGDDPAVPCVQQYLACLEQRGLDPPGNLHKARLHAFLASRPRPQLLLGQAAHAGYWPWSSPAFDLVKEFLRAL